MFVFMEQKWSKKFTAKSNQVLVNENENDAQEVEDDPVPRLGRLRMEVQTPKYPSGMKPGPLRPAASTPVASRYAVATSSSIAPCRSLIRKGPPLPLIAPSLKQEFCSS